MFLQSLLDSELLAEVYIELLGGKQASLELASNDDEPETKRNLNMGHVPRAARQRPKPLQSRLDQSQLDAHEQFIESFGGEAIWKKYK